MTSFVETVLMTLARLDARSAIDILLVAVILYWILNLIQGTTAVALVRGMVMVVLLAAVLGNVFNLVVLNWVLRNSIPAMLVSIPVLFQPELRRALERLGRTSRFLSGRGSASSEALQAMEQIAVACRRLSDRKWGALIILERETGLGEYVDTGVEVDGRVSVDLLMTIFFPNSPLHDGAAIIRGDRIVAAGCLLPLTENIMLDHQLGTRHRAGVGITERTDAVSVIVSEETGTISLANNGRIVRNLDDSKLKKVLPALYKSTISSLGLPSWLGKRLPPRPQNQKASATSLPGRNSDAAVATKAQTQSETVE